MSPGTVAPAAPTAPSDAPPAPPLREEQKAPALPPEQTTGQQTDAGTIVLHVAQSAKVLINDRPTTSVGTRRVYLAHLVPGVSYRFGVRVEDQGQIVQREIILKAGQTATVELRGTELALR